MSSPISPRWRIDGCALTRRTFLASGAVFIASAPLRAHATTDEMRAAIRAAFGEGDLNQGRVELTLPPIAENGHSVPVGVKVESPMTQADHVAEIGLFSPRNPVSHIAQFTLGPRAGRAEVSTRVRLAGTQEVHAVARMNDGTLWTGARETVVTLAACIVL